MKQSRIKKIVIAGIIWGFLVLPVSVLVEPTPENLTLGVSILLSGIYTWLLYLSKSIWLKKTVKKPLRNAILLGSVNAAVIETLFLLVEKIFDAQGVAAHPNLILDLIMTMPWYIGMVWIFVRVQQKEQFSPAIVLLFGGVYELGADGIVGGQIIPIIMGEPINLITSWILMLAIAFWQFIPVYSSMVLPPAWILDRAETDPSNLKPHYGRGFLPLLWLIPFTVYLLFLILIIGFFT